MRPAALAVLIGAVGLTGCTPAGLAGIDQAELAEQVAGAIGDPSTCVLLADRESGKVVWRSNVASVCGAKFDLCTRPGAAAPKALVKDARRGARVAASCNSSFGTGRTVGWATGQASDRLVYVAVMEGERALPGSEIQARLEPALDRAGLKPGS